MMGLAAAANGGQDHHHQQQQHCLSRSSSTPSFLMAEDSTAAAPASTDTGNRTKASTTSATKERLAKLKKDLKAWEYSFKREHGHKPSREDAKSNPAIAQMYKDYARLKREASSGAGEERRKRRSRHSKDRDSCAEGGAEEKEEEEAKLRMQLYQSGVEGMFASPAAPAHQGAGASKPPQRESNQPILSAIMASARSHRASISRPNAKSSLRRTASARTPSAAGGLVASDDGYDPLPRARVLASPTDNSRAGGEQPSDSGDKSNGFVPFQAAAEKLASPGHASPLHAKDDGNQQLQERDPAKQTAMLDARSMPAALDMPETTSSLFMEDSSTQFRLSRQKSRELFTVRSGRSAFVPLSRRPPSTTSSSLRRIDFPLCRAVSREDINVDASVLSQHNQAEEQPFISGGGFASPTSSPIKSRGRVLSLMQGRDVRSREATAYEEGGYDHGHTVQQFLHQLNANDNAMDNAASDDPLGPIPVRPPRMVSSATEPLEVLQVPAGGDAAAAARGRLDHGMAETSGPDQTSQQHQHKHQQEESGPGQGQGVDGMAEGESKLFARKSKRKSSKPIAAWDPHFLQLRGFDKQRTTSTKTAAPKGNFRKLNLKRRNFRRGAKPKFSLSHKRKNHRNRRATNTCHLCGEEGHWATACPNAAEVHRALATSIDDGFEGKLRVHEETDADSADIDSSSGECVDALASTGGERQQMEEGGANEGGRRGESAPDSSLAGDSGHGQRHDSENASGEHNDIYSATHHRRGQHELLDTAAASPSNDGSEATRDDEVTRVATTRPAAFTRQRTSARLRSKPPAAAAAVAAVSASQKPAVSGGEPSSVFDFPASDTEEADSGSATSARRRTRSTRAKRAATSDRSTTDDRTPSAEEAVACKRSKRARSTTPSSAPAASNRRSTTRTATKSSRRSSRTDGRGRGRGWGRGRGRGRAGRTAAGRRKSTRPYPRGGHKRRTFQDVLLDELNLAVENDTREPLPTAWRMDVDDLSTPLKQVWGYTSFRPGQEEAVRRILTQQSVLLVQATGSGKSLCFQMPAYLLGRKYRSFVLVISPLLSLVNDQIRNLPKQLRGGTLNSSMSREELAKTKQELCNGEVDVLFVSPETLCSHWFQTLMRHESTPRISFCCVDEAHCISEWSHNFRPAYLRIAATLCEGFGVKTILALTATATAVTKKSILRHLHIGEDGLLHSFQVPSNIHLAVSAPQDRRKRLVDLLSYHHLYSEGPAIVYCARQGDTETIASLLRTQQIDAECYHAGLESKRRSQVQHCFKTGRLRVIVATIAFGMGLDMQDVRTVVHFHLPKSPESYVQEVGRAGRDGSAAYCHLFLEESDTYFLRGHAHGDTCEEISVRNLVRQLSLLQTSDLEEEATRIVERVAATGPSGQHMLRAAKQSPTFLAVDLDATCPELDMKESVLITMVSTWQQHFPDTLQLLPRIAALLVVTIRDMEFARRDPLLAALLAVARPATSKKRNEVEIDCHGVCRVASMLATPPADVIRALYSMKASERVYFEERGQALAFSRQRQVQPSEVDDVYALLVKQMHDLEMSACSKLDAVVAMFRDAVTITPQSVEEDDTVHAAQSRLLKERLQEYFEQEEVSLPPYPQGVTAEHLEYSQLRRMLRDFISTHRDRRFTARALARLCHGLSSPAFPAVEWSRVRLWRRFSNIDFHTIRCVAQQVLIEHR